VDDADEEKKSGCPRQSNERGPADRTTSKEKEGSQLLQR